MIAGCFTTEVRWRNGFCYKEAGLEVGWCRSLSKLSSARYDHFPVYSLDAFPFSHHRFNKTVEVAKSLYNFSGEYEGSV